MPHNQLDELIQLRDALEAPAGHVLMKAITDYMIELSACAQSNPEWIKGVGMLARFLMETPQRLDRFKERSSF